ncbi:rod-binding protein [Luminiphilus sp.]|nr:rod-binding protein [Luminiphilus sp.]
MSGAIYNDFSQFTTLRAEATKNPNAALEEVAAQFESIFLQQMLKSMRDATTKSDLFDSSQMDTYQSMADQQLAVQLSEQGGIGLARMMVEQMQTRGMVSEPADASAPDAVSMKAASEPDVTQVFRPVAANAYELRSDD